MIDKRDVQAFFDRLAPDWDAGMVRNEAVIARILDNAGVCEGCTVLDVACGTGVLFGDYVKRGAARVTAVDLSPEMAARAAEKAAGTQITVVCGDVEDSAAAFLFHGSIRTGFLPVSTNLPATAPAGFYFTAGV